MKKGWEIERPVDDLSLKVESYSSKEPTLRLEHFTKICWYNRQNDKILNIWYIYATNINIEMTNGLIINS